MTEALILATGLAAGADWRPLLLAAGAVWAPIPSAVALLLAAGVGRRQRVRAGAGLDVRFAESVIGELRSGASLRSALRAACRELDGAEPIVRRLDVGEPLDRAVRGLGELLPSIGPLAEAAVSAGAGGGRMLPIFEELVIHAAAEEAVAAELRTALAPVRASMTILAGAPVAYLMWSAGTGRLSRLLALPGGLVLATLGTFLFLTGIVTMAVLVGSRR